jgi:hypothetical protein
MYATSFAGLFNCAFIVARPATISSNLVAPSLKNNMKKLTLFWSNLLDMKEFAEAPVWESAGEDVPSLLHVDISVFSHIGSCICISPPMEDSVNY